jgi:hypothetical protein
MTDLKIPFLKDSKENDLQELTLKLIETGTHLKIDKINWPEYSHKPETNVYCGYTENYLWLHYSVKDDYIRTAAKKDQDPVYQDSCVEFFIQVGENYRNFEFNCLGICLSAIGPDRNTRERLDSKSLSKIIRHPSLDPKNTPAEGTQSDWRLTVGIPLDLIQLIPGSTFRCNFYKCGDNTKKPHFVTWAPINAPAPDYHLPQFFGTLELMNN